MFLSFDLGNNQNNINLKEAALKEQSLLILCSSRPVM